MTEIKKYWPMITIVCTALLTTIFTGWKTMSEPELPWILPLIYLIICLIYKKNEELNNPIIAIIAIIVYGLSIILLSLNYLPPGLQWHYPIGGAVIFLIFFKK